MRYFHRGLLLAAWLGMTPLSAIAQTAVHVSPNGDDASDGTAARPLRTLEAARRRLREGQGTGDNEPFRVELAPGDYFLAAPLRLATGDGGLSTDRPVIYAAAKPGTVRISGGRRIAGWRPVGNHWVAKVGSEFPPFRDMWINDQRAVRARAPNTGFYRIDQPGADNRTSFTVAAADLVSLRPSDAAEIVFLHDWSISRVHLKSIDAAARTYAFADPIGGEAAQFAITNFEPHPRYFIENALDLLDQPGEWFLDQAAGEVHYAPRPGESPATVEAIAGVLDQLLVVQGDRPAMPVQHIAFSGLTFSHTRFPMPAHGYAEGQACFHERRSTAEDHDRIPLTAAVLVDGAVECRFDNCRFEHLGGCGLHLAVASKSQVSRCAFRDIGGSGVMLGRGNQWSETVTDNNAIENCLVEDCGATSFGAVGIWVGMASHSRVVHNEVRNLPYTGISAGWRWDDTPSPCHDNRVADNHIHHVMQLLSDGGGIYTLGRQPGSALAGNLIHDVPINAGRAESNGMFMDEGSTDFVVEGNTIYGVARSPIRFHRAGKNTLKGNRLAAPAGTPTFQYNAANPADMTMVDNQEIADAAWRPPADDVRVKQAGPR